MSTTRSTPGDILLDAGTNELEVLVFGLAGGWYGVNVAKVREVIRPVKVTASPHRHESVVGIFNMRGSVITMVDLKKHLTLSDEPDRDPDAEGRIIITEFNGLRTGFLVDSVEQIHRMSWQNVKTAPNLNGLSSVEEIEHGICTGIIEIGDRLVLMIDFESVADAILFHEKLHIEKVENTDNVDRASKRVILAEDSPFMRDLMQKVLRSSGYDKLEVYPDGQSAWEAVEGSLKDGSQPVDAVVSDIEMPRMDGLHMTKKIKGHDGLKHIPVVLFSSLVSEDNKKKGIQVGADVQIPKPDLPEMVILVDEAVTGKLDNGQDVAAAA